MDITILTVFDKLFKDLKIDDKLVKALYQFQTGYISQNREHMEFFGSNLLGVHVVRFTERDLIRFFVNVVDADYFEVHQAVKTINTIEHHRKVSSDTLNLTLMYLIHRIRTSDLDKKKADRAAYDTALIFFYRCIAAILSDWFSYPADPRIAQAAYARLSNRFLIKKLGSWHKVMDYRAADLVGPDGIHKEVFQTFNEDDRVVNAINDSQGRIRDLLKNYYSEFDKVHSEGESIAVSSGTWLDADGEETLKEKTKSVESIVNYIRNIVADQNSFVKNDLVSVVVKINKNTSFRMVRSTLIWMSENYSNGKNHKEIDEFITSAIIQSQYFIQHNIEPRYHNDYGYVLTSLKNLYLSTRTTDADIDKLRELGYNLIKRANGNISESLILSTRTTILLYIALRALAGRSL